MEQGRLSSSEELKFSDSSLLLAKRAEVGGEGKVAAGHVIDLLAAQFHFEPTAAIVGEATRCPKKMAALSA